MKLTILLILSHSLHVRNFVASGFVAKLASRGHRLHIHVPLPLVNQTRAEIEWMIMLMSLPPSPGASVFTSALDPYLAPPWHQRLRAIFRTASYVQRRSRSTYRHKLRLRSRTLWEKSLVLALSALSRILPLERTARWLERCTPPTLKARIFMGALRPDVLVSPTFIHDALDAELMKAAQRRGIPTIACPASWDTLTSKGTFLVPPNHLAVWGEASARHAVADHGFDPQRVTVTGPLQFDMYSRRATLRDRADFLAQRGIPADKHVILFAGTTITYWADEPQQLRALSHLVESGKLWNTVIWYRPHPRRPRGLLLPELPGVYVDDQSLRHQGAAHAYSTTGADLLHYWGLLNACDGVVTAFSTMLIEAALLGKPSLVVAFGLGDDTPARLLQHAEYEHMREVLQIPGITLCRSPEELAEGAARMILGEYEDHAAELIWRASQIALCLDGHAQDRLCSLIERIGGHNA